MTDEKNGDNGKSVNKRGDYPGPRRSRKKGFTFTIQRESRREITVPNFVVLIIMIVLLLGLLVGIFMLLKFII